MFPDQFSATSNCSYKKERSQRIRGRFVIFTDLGAVWIFTSMGGRGGSLTLLILMMMMICVCVCRVNSEIWSQILGPTILQEKQKPIVEIRRRLSVQYWGNVREILDLREQQTVALGGAGCEWILNPTACHQEQLRAERLSQQTGSQR